MKKGKDKERKGGGETECVHVFSFLDNPVIREWPVYTTERQVSSFLPWIYAGFANSAVSNVRQF